MVNLKVAAERAALEDVETRIVIAQRDIRLLQTEIGTRGRLAQLEKWNVKVLALSAPQANQFLEGGFQLATLMRPDEKIDPAAPVVLASAPAPAPRAPVMDSDGPSTQPAPTASARPSDLMHVASLKVRDETPAVSAPRKEKAVEKPAAKRTAAAEAPAKAAKPVKESEKPTAAKPKDKLAAAAKPKTTPKSKEASTDR
jgi:hypothetical protein